MDDDAASLVSRAGQGDQAAWDGLVDRYSGLLWSIARSYRLRDADASDVLQTAWMRLLEHLDRIEDPERVGAWLATVVRHEIHRLYRRSRRTVSTDDDAVLDAAVGPSSGPDAAVVRGERDRLVLRDHARLLVPRRHGDECLWDCEAETRLLGVTAALDGPAVRRRLVQFAHDQHADEEVRSASVDRLRSQTELPITRRSPPT